MHPHQRLRPRPPRPHETLTLAQRCGFRLHEAYAHLGLARLSLAEDAPADSLAHLALAREIITATGYHRRDSDLAELEAAAHARLVDAVPL